MNFTWFLAKSLKARARFDEGELFRTSLVQTRITGNVDRLVLMMYQLSDQMAANQRESLAQRMFLIFARLGIRDWGTGKRNKFWAWVRD